MSNMAMWTIWLNGENIPRSMLAMPSASPPGQHHRWFNPGDEMVRVIFAVTPPSF